MIIKKMDKTELKKSVPFIWKVFCEYEAVNYPEDGKQSFLNAISSEEYLNMLTAYGAYEGDKLIGIIASRNEGSHIALFFVAVEHQNQGIGKKLMNTLIADSKSKSITVNSSIYAAKIYEKLGFKKIDELKCEDGIQYIPYTKEK